MAHRGGWIASAAIVGCLLSACGSSSTKDEGIPEPATVESVPGSDAKRVVLTQKAAERLDIQTVAIADTNIAGTARGTVPYAAVLYGADGATWVYTSPSDLTFVRQSISVDRIDGDKAILLSGPPAGTRVVIVGGAELLGTESGVGEG